jgi:peptide/nickel transport system ATP-binding protein
VTIRDLHIRFNLGREKNALFRPAAKKRCMRYAVSASLSVRERRSASWASRVRKIDSRPCAGGLYQPASGEINYAWRSPQMAGTAGQNGTQMIFQDPYASLNPRWRIGRSLAEPLVLAKKVGTTRQAREYCGDLLTQVGLSAGDLDKFPHEFSGGQRQRISIARALATQPGFLICDEPTSALDVSVQAQVLNLMRKLQRENGLTYFFISHNMAVISHISDRVGVMYLGRLVEQGSVEEIFTHPAHPIRAC